MRREKDGQMYFMIRYFETYREKHYLLRANRRKCPTPSARETGGVGHIDIRNGGAGYFLR